MKQKSGRITRAISVLLTLTMLLTLLPTVVFAADDPAAQYGDNEYTTLSDALTAAQEGGGGTVRLLRDYTLEEDVTVPSGVTLLVPCMDNDAGYDASTGYCPDGTNTAGVTGANGTRYCTLTIPQGVTLTVMGTVLVNAVVGRPASGHYDQDVTGGYGEIALNGSIEIRSGGIVDCCGYIKGSGQVTVENGGTLRDLYVVIHWRGGSAAYGAKKASVYPMNESKCHNIETTVRINYGGTYSGTVKIYAKSPFTLKDTYQYTRFPQIDNSNGLFRLSTADSYVIKTYDAAKDREIYSFYGGATFASSSLNIVGQNLSTSEFIYPIDGDMIFNLNQGAYTFANDYKFMPGAVVNIQNAALTVNSGKTVVFYSTDIYTKDPFTTVTGTSYPVSRGDAVLKLSSDSKLDVQGAFGGKVSAQAPDSVIQKGTKRI